ncbi:MAG TPA: FAD-binding oxidoreductase [Jatrophihabitans sp.]|nr:FAD-binding oxidoreductase [Jatrophihabitans sp.]
MAVSAPDRASVRRRFSPRGLLPLLEALATPHGVDRYLELVHPMLTLRELRAVVTEVRRHRHAVTLTLRPTRQWQGFSAGQFVQVSVDVDGVRHRRCYSPACSQYRADGCLELTVKAHDAGVVSQYLYTSATRGLVVGLSQAEGSFTLPEPRPRRVVLVSGGSGITPVLSMLRTLCDENYHGEIGFLHYAPDAEHVGYLDELADLAARHDNVRLAFGFTRTGGGHVDGRFCPEHLATVAPDSDSRDAEVFVCGPAPLMEAVRGVFAAAGAEHRVHTEEFTLTPVVTDVGEASGNVSFSRSDLSAANTGATLLEQAEAAGLRPEHGCRMGICFSCTQVKKSGCTRDVRSGELHSDPDTEIQLCVNVPVGDVVVDL